MDWTDWTGSCFRKLVLLEHLAVPMRVRNVDARPAKNQEGDSNTFEAAGCFAFEKWAVKEWAGRRELGRES